MAPTSESRRSVFRRIVRKSHVEWPAYDSTTLYDRSSLTGLESDLRTVSEAWFAQDAHTSVELFVCTVSLAYFRFDPHDRYANSTRYEIATLFRLFVLKEVHGWDHETALVEYLKRRSDIRKQLEKSGGDVVDQALPNNIAISPLMLGKNLLSSFLDGDGTIT